MAQRAQRKPFLSPSDFEELERGFNSCWSGANAPPRQQHQPHRKRLRIKRKDAPLLRKSIEKGLACKWRPTEAEYPHVPDEGEAEEKHRAVIMSVGQQVVRELPKDRLDDILRMIDTLEDSDSVQAEEQLNDTLEHIISPKQVPAWLAEEKPSPVKRQASDDLKIFSSPQQPRPTSGRRARTPAGYSSAPPSGSSYSYGYTASAVGAGYTTPSEQPPARPSYEDPLDRLVNTSSSSSLPRSAPPSRSVTPPTSPQGSSILAASSPTSESLAQEDVFCIPTLPTGRELVINCLSTWGDPHYIGLNGVELFDDAGDPIFIESPEQQVSGNPPNINVLPEYVDDPRDVKNLVDNVCRTTDGYHVWLAPYTPGKDHTITIDFLRPRRISMIRFWNYNKSRPHSWRGVKNVEISLDMTYVFKGELCKAPGVLEGSEDETEIVLFTMDQEVLGKIERYMEEQGRQWTEVQQEVVNDRPATSHGARITGPAYLEAAQRPTTTVAQNAHPKLKPVTDPILLELQNQAQPPTGQVVTVSIVRGWGDMLHVGCGRIALLDADGEELEIASVSCSPKPTVDPSCLLTGDTEWFTEHDMTTILQNPVELTFKLPRPSVISGIRLWNYNESLARTFRGVKRLKLTVDGRNACSHGPAGYYIRKATGDRDGSLDFSQTVPLTRTPQDFSTTLGTSALNKELSDAIHRAKLMDIPYPKSVLDKVGMEPPLFPVGYVWRLELHTTQGDLHYIGLNGITFYDVRGGQIAVGPSNLHATPKDISVLPSNQNDCRTLDKLVDNVNNSPDDEHMWLAPFVPGRVNLLYVVFEEPVAVSHIAFWNYAKTPKRGVEQVVCYADDNLLFSGCLAPATAGCDGTDFSQHVVFSNDPSMDQLRIVPAAQSQDSGVVFYDADRARSLDNIPQTSCGRPAELQQRTMRPAQT